MKLIRDGQALYSFHAAKAAVESVVKGETADMGKYQVKYATLNAVHAEVERACELFKLVICQEPTIAVVDNSDPLFAVVNTLIHEDGSMLEFEPMCLPLPKDAQALGSATTYLRRYSLVSQFGIATPDDDGAAATTAAHTAPGRRTEAERMIRETMAQMPPEQRQGFAADFREHFKMNLADLPAARHGDALQWAKAWRAPDAEDIADKEFVAAAKGEASDLAQEGST